MATTRRINQIRLMVNEASDDVERIRLSATEQPPVDPANPDYPVPERSVVVYIDPDTLGAGAQTTLRNIVAAVNARLNADRPLNTG